MEIALPEHNMASGLSLLLLSSLLHDTLNTIQAFLEHFHFRPIAHADVVVARRVK